MHTGIGALRSEKVLRLFFLSMVAALRALRALMPPQKEVKIV